MDDPSMGEPFSPRKQNLSPFICPHGKDHTPNTCDRRKELRNWLFQAAYQGCKPCVSHCIGEIGIDPGTQSYQRKHTAMTWAKWGREQQVPGTEEVVAYLASLVPVLRSVHAKRRRVHAFENVAHNEEMGRGSSSPR